MSFTMCIDKKKNFKGFGKAFQVVLTIFYIIEFCCCTLRYYSCYKIYISTCDGQQ